VPEAVAEHRSSARPDGLRTAVAVAGFAALLVAFWALSKYFGIAARLGDHLTSARISFALLLAPYWAFGFGLDRWLQTRVRNAVARILTPALLVLPYLVFALPMGQFRWSICFGLLGVIFSFTLVLNSAGKLEPGWRDALALAILAISVELHFFDAAWPVAGLNGMAKLVFVDAALYGYLVVRPIGGIGFDLLPCSCDLKIGLREFLHFTPIALLLGFALGFLHLHRMLASPAAFGAGWLFTLFFVALPEELFFRGLVLNMLERRVGTRWALLVTAAIFGLAHFNKRAAFFNWRYVILATIAGIYYGRAWLAGRRLLGSSITHATVDTVWALWLR